MKTRFLKAGEIEKKWHLVDADRMVLGRLAAILSTLIRGKHKPSYTPYLDCGDKVVVINASRIHLTGNKRRDRLFYWHSGYPGGIKRLSQGEIVSGRYPERVLRKAVERMVPRGPLGRKNMDNLLIYPNQTHPHQAQSPSLLDIATWNSKNLQRTHHA